VVLRPDLSSIHRQTASKSIGVSSVSPGVGDYREPTGRPREYKCRNVFWVGRPRPAGAQLQAYCPTGHDRKLVTTPCGDSSATTHASRCCRRITPELASTAAPGNCRCVSPNDRTHRRQRSEGPLLRRAIARDLLGRVYNTSSPACSAEAKERGQFYTPSLCGRCLVEMLEPYKGRIYDPCCGSLAMFAAEREFVGKPRRRAGDISSTARRGNANAPRRLQVMTWPCAASSRTSAPSIARSFPPRHSSRSARLRNRKSPFNDSDWFRRTTTVGCSTGVTAERANSQLRLVQHFDPHLAPRRHGRAFSCSPHRQQ